MKTFLFLIFTLALVQQGNTQSTWFPTGAKWYYQYGAMTGHGMTIVEVMNEDTLIGNGVYRKLLSTTIGEFLGEVDTFTETLYVIEESQVVYGYDRFHGGSFLYNFNATVGDTLPMYFGGLSPAPFVIDSIGVIELNGRQLVFQDIRFPNFYEPGEFFKMRVIERIGASTSHLFHSRTVIQPFDAPAYYLRCYEDDELGLIRFTDDSGPCNLLEETTSTSENTKSSISIYPNPTADVVQVEGYHKGLVQWRIVDMLGTVRIKTLAADYPSLKIDISSLESGLYYIIGSGATGEILFNRKISKLN